MGATGRFELFDHTADVGVHVAAPTQPALIPPAIQGLYAIIGTVVAGDETTDWKYTARGAEPALLLHDLLAEVLFLLSSRGQCVHDVVTDTFDETVLAVNGRLALLDKAASTLDCEVKAVTYHALALCATDDGYEATYIVDV